LSSQQIASAFGHVAFIRVTRQGQRTDTEVCAIALQALEDCVGFTADARTIKGAHAR